MSRAIPHAAGLDGCFRFPAWLGVDAVRRTAMTFAVFPEIAEPQVEAASPVQRDHAPFTCLRGTRRVRIMPRYGKAATDAEVRYLWAGAPGAPTVIVQGGISADRSEERRVGKECRAR